MYCPNCGQKNYNQQKFCRSCGMNLEQTATALVEQFPSGGPDRLALKEQRLERFGQIAFGGFGVVIVIAILGIIYTIFTNMILAGTQPLAGVILVLFLIFAALTLAYVVFAEELKEKRKKMMKNPAAATPTSEPDTNKLLNVPADPSVASVVEDTTELLPVEKKPREL